VVLVGRDPVTEAQPEQVEEIDLCRVLEAVSASGGATEGVPDVPGVEPDVAGKAAIELEHRRWISVDSPRLANDRVVAAIRPRITAQGQEALRRYREQRIGVPETPGVTVLDSSIEAKDVRRGQFMQRLYDLTDGSQTVFVKATAIGDNFGWPSSESVNVADYLDGRGLVKFIATEYLMAITQRGIEEVEQSKRKPTERTTNLPALNTYTYNTNVTVQGPMSQSQIVAGSPGASQSLTLISNEESTSIHNGIEAYRGALLAEPFSDPADVAAATTTLDAIDAQLSHPKPSRRMIAAGLDALRELAIGVTASAVWTGALELLPHIHL
jgi:hypothetical protein